MKTLFIIFFLAFITDGVVVKKLNHQERELKYCSENNELKKWEIDCASDFRVTFLEAELINKKMKTYKLSGRVSEITRQLSLPDMNINYGDVNNNICNLKQIGKTDSEGQFIITVQLIKGKIVQFNMVGFKSIIINLDIN
ncbi:MAG: hypothetical protein H6589_06840 [Flavobacteriales bacterium]|nr:hypothetical protein [Flavobacteriales bacterium]